VSFFAPTGKSKKRLFKGKRCETVTARATVNSKSFARCHCSKEWEGAKFEDPKKGSGCESGNLAAAFGQLVIYDG